MRGQGSITFSEDYRRKIVYFCHAQSIAKVENFAAFLADYSHANLTVCTQTDIQDLDYSGDFAVSVRMFAKIFIRQSSSGKLYAIIVPAPKMIIFEQIEEQGWRIKKEIGELMAQEYSTMAGEAFTFQEGWLCGSTQ
jgi:hypothetical protein